MSYTGDKDYDEMLEMCFSVMKTKGVDYAGLDDRLSEIRHTAKDTGATMRQVLGAYMNKHLRSIFKWIKGQKLRGEPVEEKIKDMIVYLLMTYKLVKEEQNAAQQEAEDDTCEVCKGTGGVEAFQNGRTSVHPCPRGCDPPKKILLKG